MSAKKAIIISQKKTLTTIENARFKKLWCSLIVCEVIFLWCFRCVIMNQVKVYLKMCCIGDWNLPFKRGDSTETKRHCFSDKMSEKHDCVVIVDWWLTDGSVIILKALVKLFVIFKDYPIYDFLLRRIRHSQCSL